MKQQELPDTGVYKLRVLYGEHFQGLETYPYTIKPVRTLRLVEGNGLQYSKKYANRLSINELLAQRGECDDILITQHGFLTDTSYANIALYDGTGWFTPSCPLLRGTRRAKLLQEGTIKAAVIRSKDLPHFKKIRLMNSMLPWEEAPTLAIHQIEGLNSTMG